MIQPYYLMFLMQTARSQNSSSSTPFTNPSYSCRRYKHFLSCKLSGQCLQKEYNLQVFSISFFTYYVQQITCKDEHSHARQDIKYLQKKQLSRQKYNTKSLPSSFNSLPQQDYSYYSYNRQFLLISFQISQKLWVMFLSIFLRKRPKQNFE